MTTIVILGGTGYIGTAIAKEWQKRYANDQLYLVSRNGKQTLQSNNVHYIKADVTNKKELMQQLPNHIDYIINCVGVAFKPKNSEQTLYDINMKPAIIVNDIAKTHHVKAQGFIGGILGSKEFTSVKKDIINLLNQSDVPSCIVEPTIVYSKNRNDVMAYIMPIFKFLGLFIHSLKPIHATDVANQLIDKMVVYNEKN